MYFDRRNDPNNFFIDTYLSRSNDGGQDVHGHARHAHDVGPAPQPADLGVGRVHRRLPGARRRRQRGDPVLERHAGGQPADGRSGVLALPGGPVRAHPERAARGRAHGRLPRHACAEGTIPQEAEAPDQGEAQVACAYAARRATGATAATAKPRVRSVVVSVALRRGKGRCRHLQSTGRLGQADELQAADIPARPRPKQWKFKSKKVHLKRGPVRDPRAGDRRGGQHRPQEPKRGKRRNFSRRVRVH